MALHKVTIKLYNDLDRTQAWVHFCYVNDKVYLKFNNMCSCRRTRTEWIRYWIKKDFNLFLTSINELNLAKDAIRDSFKAEYPELFLSSLTDRQGWIRVWLTKKIEEAKLCIT